MERSGFDRRTDDSRRTVYNLNYFEEGGVERRHSERRTGKERRDNWTQVTSWTSVYHGNAMEEY